MNKKTRQDLEAEGWEFGSAQEFLNLHDADTKYVDFKIALKEAVKSYRVNADLSQESLAKSIESSQSRIAKIEAGDASVSIDLMIRAFFGTGADLDDLATAISPELQVAMDDIKAGTEKINASILVAQKRLNWLENHVHQIKTALPDLAEYKLVDTRNFSSSPPDWNTIKPSASTTH